MNKILSIIIIFSFAQVNGMSRARRVALILTRGAQKLNPGHAILNGFKINQFKKNDFIFKSSKRNFATSSQMSQKTAYEYLRLSQNTCYSRNDLEIIRKHLLSLYHPDKNPKFTSESNKCFVNIQNALEVVIEHQRLINNNISHSDNHTRESLLKQYDARYQEWKNNLEYQRHLREEQREREEQKKRQEERSRQRRKRYTTAAVTGTSIAASALYLKYIDNEIKKKEYFDVIKSGDLEKVKRYFENPEFDPNIVDSEYNVSGFTWAALKGHIKILNLFLNDSRFEKFNETDKNGTTPLGNAIINSQIEIIKLLINDHRIEINVNNMSRQNTIDLIDTKHVLSNEILDILIKAIEERIVNYDKNSFDSDVEFENYYIFEKLIKGKSLSEQKKIYLKNKKLFCQLIYKFKYADSDVFKMALEENDYELLIVNLKISKYTLHAWLFEKIKSNSLIRLLFYFDIKKVNNSNSFLGYFMAHPKMDNDLLFELVDDKYSELNNTVWHYLIKYSENYSLEELKQRVKICSQITLKNIKQKNADGKTPKELATQKNNKMLINIFEILEKKADEQIHLLKKQLDEINN